MLQGRGELFLSLCSYPKLVCFHANHCLGTPNKVILEPKERSHKTEGRPVNVVPYQIKVSLKKQQTSQKTVHLCEFEV